MKPTRCRRRFDTESGGSGIAVVALACALAAVGATQLLLDTPRSRDQLAESWAPMTVAEPVRTVSAVLPVQPGAPVSIPPTARFASGNDMTGSLGLSGTGSAFGADLGGSPDIRDIKAMWSKVQSAAAHVGRSLRPMLTLDGAPAGQELRLVVGPLQQTSDVTALCQALAGQVSTCRPVPYARRALPSP